jgi:wyosine [tRNA(Phe)-imidazoG37] synthetase (radical SAM superfamily)
MVKKINKPRGHFNLERMIQILKEMRDVVIQSLFMQGSFDNTRPEEIEIWIEKIKFIQPCEVQVYTLDRKPADPGLRKVSRERLDEIAKACESATGIPCIVY